MLTKILFTLVVIVVVALVFRNKSATRKPVPSKTEPAAETGVQSRTVIYALLGLIVAISALVFALHWQDQHQIINIRVTNGAGETVNYQAYKKSVDGRRFTTLDGREVTLGDGDRVEMTGSDES